MVIRTGRAKLICLLIATSGLLAGCGGPARVTQNTHPVTFQLSLDKSTYARGESIRISFSLRNTGHQPAWVNKRMFVSGSQVTNEHREIFLRVSTSSGQSVDCERSFSAGLPRSDDFMLLEAGQEAVGEQPRDLRADCTLEHPGTYRIVAVYDNSFGSELGLETVKGPLTSPTVTFSVAE